MRRYVVIAAGTLLVLGVMTLGNSVPAIAQGALKPLAALIVNGDDNPVPVKVVPPAARSLVMCELEVGLLGAGTAFIGRAGAFAGQAAVHCPDGVLAIDVQRVSFSPDAKGNGLSSVNVSSYRVSVADGSPGGDFEKFIAILTDGAPTANVVSPFRLDKTSDRTVFLSIAATSGIASAIPTFTGTLYLIGHPVQ